MCAPGSDVWRIFPFEVPSLAGADLSIWQRWHAASQRKRRREATRLRASKLRRAM